MTQPAVIITELDGSLGVLPPSSGRLLAVIGPANAGPMNTPATFARVRDLVNTFTSGPAVEAAAHHIDVSGRPVLFVRSAASVAGVASPIVSVPGAGTAVITIDGTPARLVTLISMIAVNQFLGAYASR